MRAPRYVKMGSNFLRLRGDDMYCVDGGEWGVSFVETNLIYDNGDFRKSYFKSVSAMNSLNNNPLYEATEAEYINANFDYIPKGYKLENGDTFDTNDWDDEDDEIDEGEFDSIDEYGESIRVSVNNMYLLIRK